MRRALLLLKRSAIERAAANLQDRNSVHEATVEKCKDVLERRGFFCKFLYRDELQDPIRNVDMVVTVGGDGTLLHASHYLCSSIPILGVNSDPTQSSEVEENLEEFDATRSAGYLCAATKEDFEQVLEEILEEKRHPLCVHRISMRVNGVPLKTFALNDVLLAHPSPAAVTRCSFRICKKMGSNSVSPLIHTRSSGLRICTAVGSTAAMHSAGGYIMSPLSPDLQYMIREPISPHPAHQKFMHEAIHEDEVLHVKFSGRQGNAYLDGPYIYQSVAYGDDAEFSNEAPKLKIFLSNTHT